MIPLIKSSYDTYNTCTSETPNKQMMPLIKDLEAKLPNLSASEQIELTDRIEAMKTAAKTHAVNNSFYVTGIQLFKAGVGLITGPLGSAIATYYTHDIVSHLKNETRGCVKKAEKIAGRRMARSYKKEKLKNSSAVQEAAKSGLKGVAVAASDIRNIAFTGFLWGFSLGKSYLFG